MNFRDFSRLMKPGSLIAIWVTDHLSHPIRLSCMHDGALKVLVTVLANLPHRYVINDRTITLLSNNGKIIEQSLWSWYNLVKQNNIGYELIFKF